ncbi:MAG: DUF1934 domain-containing protein [Clostridia bacterium]|nr:DUF1934 domain-containing protein [Clostridia bacterium]MBQ3897854.1 DUF1934 domain-containing protein [Clostridia bacterium]
MSILENFDENYKIIIRDRHTVAGEVSESTTELFGELAVAQGGYVIRYNEHEGDFAGTTTNISVMGPDSLRLSRGGSFGIDFLLEEGKRHNCFYDTPYGRLEMGVYAKKIDSDMKDNGGNLKFAYSLDIGGGEVSENELELEVREMKQRGARTDV